MTITTQHGTLEIRSTSRGRIIRINGQHVTEVDFLLELVDAYYRLDLDHPGGSGGWLRDLIGLDTALGCAGCGSDNARTTRCPTCSFPRCAQCAVHHDNSTLCQLTREAADTHRQMRDDTDLNPSDFYFARRAMAASFLRRAQH